MYRAKGGWVQADCWVSQQGWAGQCMASAVRYPKGSLLVVGACQSLAGGLVEVQLWAASFCSRSYMSDRQAQASGCRCSQL